MDSLVPSLVSLGGVAFPLMVTPAEITVLSYSLDDIFAAPTVVVGELTSGDGKDVPIDQLAREGFNVPYVHAVVVRPDQTVDELLDGLINWRRLSGQWPERSRSVHLTAVEAARRRLVIPAGVLGAGERERLAALGLTALVAYADAAVEMERYLASPGYARLVRRPRPERVIDSLVSLDWFRRTSGYVAANLDPFDWLALCEN